MLCKIKQSNRSKIVEICKLYLDIPILTLSNLDFKIVCAHLILSIVNNIHWMNNHFQKDQKNRLLTETDYISTSAVLLFKHFSRVLIRPFTSSNLIKESKFFADIKMSRSNNELITFDQISDNFLADLFVIPELGTFEWWISGLIN